MIYLLLEVAVLAIYGQVAGFDSVNYDDGRYVARNRHTQQGLTTDAIRWAFTTGEAANWHPITWLSLMLDVQLLGLRPVAHHLVNAGFHLVNSLLLFWLLKRMTGRRWRSALVAALFAVHPLHVESVAWISERKDVLSTLFWILTTAAYTDYVARRKAAPYVAMVLWFSLGLMTKPMLVTLPATLLLLDVWPLRRLKAEGWGRKAGDGHDAHGAGERAAALLIEKIPLFVLAVASSVITVVVQHRGEAVITLGDLPLYSRFENAVVSYARYIGMMLWPRGFAVLYPHPGPVLPLGQVLVAGAVLAAISAAVAVRARRYPYLIVGWLWYLGTLAPVIGIVQVGKQALANRYTYVPSIGLFLIAAWGGADLASKLRLPKAIAPIVGSAAVLAFAVCAAMETSHWRDSIPLWTHTLKNTTGNYIAHKGLAVVLADDERYPEAIDECRKGLRIRPDDVDLHCILGEALAQTGTPEQGAQHYLRALRVKPDSLQAHYGLGKLYAKQRQFDLAIAQFDQAIALQPDHVPGHLGIADALASSGKPEEAAAHYQEALCINPHIEESLIKLGDGLMEEGKLDQAAENYLHVVRINPANEKAREKLDAIGDQAAGQGVVTPCLATGMPSS